MSKTNLWLFYHINEVSSVTVSTSERGLRSELAGMKKVTYEVDLLCIEVFRQEGRPSENFIAFVFWDLVKLCANQQQRHWVLSKLLSIIVTAGRKRIRH